MTRTTIHSVKRAAGIAGQFSVTADVTHHHDAGDDRSSVTFVGSVYGGPVVMVLESGTQTFVSEPGRFGETFGEAWVRAFLTGEA